MTDKQHGCPLSAGAGAVAVAVAESNTAGAMVAAHPDKESLVVACVCLNEGDRTAQIRADFRSDGSK